MTGLRKKIMIVGGGGRESAFAVALAADCAVYAVVSHENPTIMRCVAASGGAAVVGDVCDPAFVAGFARAQGVELVFVSADAPLAAGVVDALLADGIAAVGGSRAATRIEWDKVYSIELMRQVCPEVTPFYQVVESPAEVDAAVQRFRERGAEIVVKPQGLTGGKGVRVMPTHLPTHEAAADYARELLTAGGDARVLLVEKLHGREFTIMGLTDGVHLTLAPATYDYPYRFEGDAGPGTGGMGCFTDVGGRLPFMREQDWRDCREVMQRVVDRLRADGLHFNGVLNAGFFLTSEGIRFMEFNARFGDPEALNIIPLLQTPLSHVLEAMAAGALAKTDIRFARQASVVKYLVAREYPEESAQALSFAVDEQAIEAMGARVYYASCVAARGGDGGGDTFQTLKKSRVLALTALSDSVSDASARINQAIDLHVRGDLHYRRDIGDADEMQRLKLL